MPTTSLKDLHQQIHQCQNCPLYKSATQSVPGQGNPQADILFIGEAPGHWEDQKGIPFCGRSGNLLDQMLETINLSRQDVFITNILKHRPPQNRDPSPQEITACQSWLDQQLQLIKPQIIVTLGRFSMNKFIPQAKISQIHGQARYITYAGSKYLIVPMYHPAAALRGTRVMNEFKADFLKLPRYLEATLTSPSSEESDESKDNSSSKSQLDLFT